MGVDVAEKLWVAFCLQEVQEVQEERGGKKYYVGRCRCGHDAVEPIVALSPPKKQLTDPEEAVTLVFESVVTYHVVTLVVATCQLANVMGWF